MTVGQMQFFPKGQKKFLNSLKSILDYNEQVGADERFDGFQSDVEPGCLKEYHQTKEKRREINRNFIQLHADCRKMISGRKVKDFTFGIALFEHYDTPGREGKILWNGKKKLVCDHFIDFVDYFAMMSYHDIADETIGGVKYEVKLAGEHGKKAWVGYETLDMATRYGGSRAITFYEEGLDKMEEEIAKAVDVFKDQPGFGGIAVHYYDSYRRLPNVVEWKWDKGMAPPDISAEKLTGKVNIDSRPVEWKQKNRFRISDKLNVAYGREKWQGEKDLSGIACTGWDENNLYVYMEVKDDVLKAMGEGVDLWKGDHIEIWVSIDNDLVYQIGFSPGDFKNKKPQVYIWYPKSLELSERLKRAEKIKFNMKSTLNGYRFECRIPADILGSKKLSASSKIKLMLDIGGCGQGTGWFEKPYFFFSGT